MKNTLRKFAAVLLVVSSVATPVIPASAEVVNGCSVAADSSDSVSLGSATLDEDEDYTILAEMTLHFSVQVDSSTLPAANQEISTTSANVDVPMVATITVAQKSGTQKLTTSVTVRPENLMYNPLIRSVKIKLKYVNQTESTIPDSNESFTIQTNNPSNYLSGTHTSNQSFIKGNRIATTVTIQSISMDNGTWTGPVSASRTVTIK